MALVAGPGIGGDTGAQDSLPAELKLVIDKHVKYIQSLDTVRLKCEWFGMFEY
jgi:geranylgeranyl transferase type-2 subunit beta